MKISIRRDCYLPAGRVFRFKPLALLNPAALFEVLSTSTAEKDLTTKSDAYFRLASVHLYLIVSQEQIRVEVRARGLNGWEITVYNRSQDEIELAGLGINLPLSEIYEGLNLPSLIPRENR